MNMLETFVVILNFGVLMWVFTSRIINRWKVTALIVSFMVTFIHMMVAARWQMIFIYFIPVVTTLYMVYRKNKSNKRKKWNFLLGTSLVIIYGLFSIVLPSILPMFTFPHPTGTYQVGTTTFHLQDENHELMMQVWYPSDKVTHYINSPYIRDVPEVTAQLSNMLGLPSFTLKHLGDIPTHSYLDAPLSKGQPSYPVLLFSHGLGGVRNQNTFQVEELASHGYIVVGFDHPTYAAATVFSDGVVINNQHPSLLEAGTQELDTHMTNWASNSTFVLDQLEQLNESSIFKNTMDLNQIGMFGHSYGGATATYMLIHDERIKAAINMDGGTFGLEEWPSNLKKPLLLMAADSSLDKVPFYQALEETTDKEVLERTGQTKEWHKNKLEEAFTRRERMLETGAESMVLPNTSHLSFSDLPLYAPFLLTPEGNPKEGYKIINEACLLFFDKHLK
ncbi:alpha/beta fold hydrolase [Bacillus carboniphilus]|uniref:Alpha/beta fold hydrolase n=1 Tax=Bacillus carboniphilus TaxID=86663 RepID=A0ABY9JXX8_9BACI|nr:alpha/beta fold hydrolase [Bacillus carboniphilus]WLR44256.1 alpha/beta fold hydrolase [Bacillus carboniphilus]